MLISKSIFIMNINLHLTKKLLKALVVLTFSLSILFTGTALIHQSNVSPMTNLITTRKESYSKEPTTLLKRSSTSPQPYSVGFSTYFTSTGNNSVRGTTVDSQGNIYITGSTNDGLPVKNAWDNTYNGKGDAFLAKFSPTGYLLYSTYFGGSGSDEAEKVVVDNSGNMYIYGTTSSSDLPMKNAYQGGIVGVSDTFIAKFNSSGQLVLSTYFGAGGEGENALSMAVDNGGNIFVVGNTNTQNFPLKNAVYKTNLGGYSTCFVAKFDSQGDLVFSTYLGGAGNDYPYSIALDSNDTAYIVGLTNSQAFPLSTNAYSKTLGAINGFLSIFTSSGSLKYSTYLGAGGLSTKNYPHSVFVDSTGNIYITGSVASSNLPTTKNAFNATYSNNFDAYALKFSPSMTLLYGSYVGGAQDDEGWSIRADTAGNMFIGGVTYSSDFPTKYPVQGTYKVYEEAFVTEIFANGSLAFSTFYSGSQPFSGSPITECRSMAIDKYDNIIFAGYTNEKDFPTSNAYYPMDRAVGSGFLVELSNTSAPIFVTPIHILSNSSSSNNSTSPTTTNTSTHSPLLPNNVINNPVFEGVALVSVLSVLLNAVFIFKRRK